ncbi:hypothetical protein DPMN_154173 [Dreissena polymorpha]|uniref:Uncharacterized protein n=1 Tax=Dreissena polymorpha TaxID=45954 RepID=A0A9D4J6R3_DREPO|nr:hypothetical protein DPMN_154173 [Dreissena polymorpha]
MLGRRIRALTEKGNMMYDDKVAEFYSRLKKCRDVIVECSEVNIDLVLSIRTINKLEDDVSRQFEQFSGIASTFEDFLVATRTSESENELGRLKRLIGDTSATVQETFKHIDSVKQGILESLAQRSTKSLSNKSDTSMEEKQARAKALKVRAAFAQKETELKKRKAALEADLELLSEQLLPMRKILLLNLYKAL